MTAYRLVGGEWEFGGQRLHRQRRRLHRRRACAPAPTGCGSRPSAPAATSRSTTRTRTPSRPPTTSRSTLGATATANAVLDRGRPDLRARHRALGRGHRRHRRRSTCPAASRPPAGAGTTRRPTRLAAPTPSRASLPGPYRVCVDRPPAWRRSAGTTRPRCSPPTPSPPPRTAPPPPASCWPRHGKITGTVTSRAGGALTRPVGVGLPQAERSGRHLLVVRHVRRPPPRAAPTPSDVAPGTYRVSASATEHRSATTATRPRATRPTRIVVAAGADQTGQGHRPRPLGRISGTVTGPSGPSPEPPCASTGGPTRASSRSGSAQTTAGGAYSVTDLNPGNYRVGLLGKRHDDGVPPRQGRRRGRRRRRRRAERHRRGQRAPGLQPAHPVRHRHRGRRRSASPESPCASSAGCRPRTT